MTYYLLSLQVLCRWWPGQSWWGCCRMKMLMSVLPWQPLWHHCLNTYLLKMQVSGMDIKVWSAMLHSDVICIKVWSAMLHDDVICEGWSVVVDSINTKLCFFSLLLASTSCWRTSWVSGDLKCHEVHVRWLSVMGIETKTKKSCYPVVTTWLSLPDSNKSLPESVLGNSQLNPQERT